MPTEHACLKEGILGGIRNELQTRKEEGAELKGQLQTLTTMLTTTQNDQIRRDGELKNDLTSIATILKGEQERRQELAAKVDAQTKALNDVSTNMALMLEGINKLTNLHSSADRIHANFDKRLSRLEKIAWIVYIAVVAIIIMGSFIGWLFSTINTVQEVTDHNNQTIERQLNTIQHNGRQQQKPSHR